MDLFGLPPELVQIIFENIVRSRQFGRVMRMRVVSHQFKTNIDYAIFRIRLLSELVGPPINIEHVARGNRSRRDSIFYVRSYIIYQVPRETSTTSPLGRIRRAAEALCEQDGDTENENVLPSLIDLAMEISCDALLRKPRTEEPDECSDDDLKADMYVAAIYLGRQSYVKSLIADGVEFCGVADLRNDIRSKVFGSAFHAAALKGNLDMIKLLLSCLAEYRDTGLLPYLQQREILLCIGSHNHPAPSDFALDTRPIHLPKTKAERRGHPDIWVLENAIRATPFPKIYERLAAMLGPDSKVFEYYNGGSRTAWLQRQAYRSKVEMVRYVLDGGAEPNYTNRTRNQAPLLSAVRSNSETIVRLLLEAGADPNLPLSPYSPILFAVWKGNIAIVKMLLSKITDINEGCPPPIVLAVFKERMDMFRLLRDHGARLDTPETGGWAMAIAKLHELDSMVDVLVHEGVGQDFLLQQALPFRQHLWQNHLQLPLPQGETFNNWP